MLCPTEIFATRNFFAAFFGLLAGIGNVVNSVAVPIPFLMGSKGRPRYALRSVLHRRFALEIPRSMHLP
jgi:hypothetical protein